MSLQDALQIVRDELVGNESVESAIALAAEETGLNPKLIARKAAESFGELATFGERERVRLWRAEVRMAELKREADADAAAAEAAQAAKRRRREPSGDTWARDMRALLRLMIRANRG